MSKRTAGVGLRYSEVQNAHGTESAKRKRRMHVFRTASRSNGRLIALAEDSTSDHGTFCRPNNMADRSYAGLLWWDGSPAQLLHALAGLSVGPPTPRPRHLSAGPWPVSGCTAGTVRDRISSSLLPCATASEGRSRGWDDETAKDNQNTTQELEWANNQTAGIKVGTIQGLGDVLEWMRGASPTKGLDSRTCTSVGELGQLVCRGQSCMLQNRIVCAV